jgi:hypothetical protein
MFIVFQSSSKEVAKTKISTIFNNYKVFKNYPQNQFRLQFHDKLPPKLTEISKKMRTNMMSSDEISNIFHFPQKPKTETSLLTIKSRKLALPIGVPTYDFDVNEDREIIAKNFPREATILGITDYRSITVPIGLYDEDRLRHVYVVGQT